MARCVDYSLPYYWRLNKSKFASLTSSRYANSWQSFASQRQAAVMNSRSTSRIITTARSIVNWVTPSRTNYFPFVRHGRTIIHHFRTQGHTLVVCRRSSVANVMQPEGDIGGLTDTARKE